MTIITQKREVAARYLDYLEREIAMLSERMEGRRLVVQHHWGGGTPSYLTLAQIDRLYATIARHFDFDQPRRSWLTAGGHGAMGFDLPAAIGAQLARPDATVLCFVGDGSLQINIQELQAALDYRTALRIIVLDNRRLGIVSQFQMLNWQSDPTTGNKQNPDFAAIARAWGLSGLSVDRPQDVQAVLADALHHPGPVLVHCHVDPAEDVVPMLLAGQTMDRMWPYSEVSP